MADTNPMNESMTEPTKVSQAKSRVPLMAAAGLVLVVGGAIAGVAFLLVDQQRVYIDKAQIAAPQIVLSATSNDTLKQVFVSVGDTIAPNTVVAQVGTELVKSTSGGIVIMTDKDIGSIVGPTTAVVTIVDPSALRVNGQVQEDKGLASINVGDRAVFTVDAFGSKKFEGVVSEVSPTSHASDVVFSVSDKRQEQTFDVKVSYDVSKYPELHNGMSAKIYVYKQ